MNIKEKTEKENKRKERPGYNKYYNRDFLEAFNLLIQDGEAWLSSLDLSEMSGRTHDNVLKDIRRDIISVYDSLGLKTPIINHLMNNSGKLVKFHEGSKFNLSDIVDASKVIAKMYSNENYSFSYEIVRNLKIISKKRQSGGGLVEYYLLNREVALMCIMRYSPVIRAHVSNLFFKSVDMLKSKGHKIESVKDMYMTIDEEIENSIDTLESDLDESGILSEFNMWHLLWLLLRKIPKSIAKYFAKEFPSFYNLYDMAQRHGDFTSPYFEDPDKKRL